MRTAMRAARTANGAASRMIAMAAFMRSGYAIHARAIVRILCGQSAAEAAGGTHEHRRRVTLL
jgi:hypothetical protein